MESLSEQRRVLFSEENVIGVNLVSGDSFIVDGHSYTEMDDPELVGPGGQVSFMIRTGPTNNRKLVLAYQHQILYLVYGVPYEYKETRNV